MVKAKAKLGPRPDSKRRKSRAIPPASLTPTLYSAHAQVRTVLGPTCGDAPTISTSLLRYSIALLFDAAAPSAGLAAHHGSPVQSPPHRPGPGSTTPHSTYPRSPVPLPRLPPAPGQSPSLFGT